MKNQIRLAGKLCTDVFLGESASGCAFAKARVKFNAADDSIWIFCIARLAEELSLFREGEEIFVMGRLVIRGERGSAAIAVDRIETEKNLGARDDAQFYFATQTHLDNARFRGR
jgi:hypothetical protein